MGRLLCVFAACLFCAGAAGAHLFAGLSERSAAAEGTEVTKAFAPGAEGYEDPAVYKNLRLVDIVRSKDSVGREAWLAVFRYPGGHDAACVWVRGTAEGPTKYAFEESQSVAYGPAPERVHDRCARVAFRLRLLGPNDDAGSAPTPAYAHPQPVSPFGVVPRGSYLADLEDTDGASLTGIPAKFPETTAPGTTGVEGFVVDERTWRVIRGATVAVAPSSSLSGFSRLPRGRFRPVLQVTTDRRGSFAILDLPARKLGYDVVVTAPGYAPAYDVHALSQPTLFIGDYSVARHPRFFDDTIAPVCGSSC